jgi:hypothetical protein
LLQEVHAQHPLQAHRLSPTLAFEIEWLDTRHQFRPRNNRLHLAQETLTAGLLFLLRVFGLGKDVLSAGKAFLAEVINIFAGGRMVGVFVVV